MAKSKSSKPKRSFPYQTLFLKTGGTFLLVILSLILFIKLETGAAAIITDNILRPLLGPNLVIFMEKVYYNSSDKLLRLTYNPQSQQAPQFLDAVGLRPAIQDHLDMTAIPTNPRFKTLIHEGVWIDRPLLSFPNQEVAAYTFIRPDPDRPYAVVTLLQVSSQKIGLGSVAGTKQPGGPAGHPGPGTVPSDILKSGRLVGAFDGGFQYRDGQYGMVVGSETYLPLKLNLGTVVGYKDGSFQIVNYTGQSFGPNVTFIRQNCPILIDNGKLSVIDPINKQLWGRTPAVSTYTWRSGIGVNSHGNLLFAVGNNLTPETLAKALKLGGAVNALQLDINPFWVRFNLFSPKGNGLYATSTLTADLKDGSHEYLHGYEKDFFYLFVK